MIAVNMFVSLIAGVFGGCIGAAFLELYLARKAENEIGEFEKVSYIDDHRAG